MWSADSPWPINTPPWMKPAAAMAPGKTHRLHRGPPMITWLKAYIAAPMLKKAKPK